MSTYEVTIPIIAVDQASSTIRSVASEIAALGSLGSRIVQLSSAFGILNQQHASFLSLAMSTVSVIASVAKTMQSFGAITTIAAAAQTILTSSYAGFLALTGIGIGLVLAAAAAMGVFADQATRAGQAVIGIGSGIGGMPSSHFGDNIVRRGELGEIYRRGIED